MCLYFSFSAYTDLARCCFRSLFSALTAPVPARYPVLVLVGSGFFLHAHFASRIVRVSTVFFTRLFGDFLVFGSYIPV